MQPNPNAPLILWCAFLVSQLLFAGVTFAVPPIGEDQTVGLVLILPALVTAGMSLVSPMVFGGKAPPQTLLLLRFVFAEAAALFGLMSYFLSGERVPQAVCALVAFVAHAVAVPLRQQR